MSPRSRAAEPRSDRTSYLGLAEARSYDEDLWERRTAKRLDWPVEQTLLAATQ